MEREQGGESGKWSELGTMWYCPEPGDPAGPDGALVESRVLGGSGPVRHFRDTYEHGAYDRVRIVGSEATAERIAWLYGRIGQVLADVREGWDGREGFLELMFEASA